MLQCVMARTVARAHLQPAAVGAGRETSMKAVVIETTGGPEVIVLRDVETPVPGQGQILIRNEAIGLNYIDVYHRTGLYPLSLPSGLGGESAGTVEAVGPGVSRFAVGDRVASATGGLGAYAEMRLVDADRAVRIPDALSTEVAAAVMLKGLTAEFLIRRAFRVEAGMSILVQAAAGGVGSLLSQWASSLGARVIGTAGSEDKAAFARANGCDAVILYRHEDVAERVRALTDGKGVSVVYDAVGAATFDCSLASLARRGMLVSFGNASGPVPPVPPLKLSQGGSLYLTRPTLFDYVATVDELDAAWTALTDVLISGAVTPHIGARFDLADVQAAHRALEARETVGSTILLPGA